MNLSHFVNFMILRNKWNLFKGVLACFCSLGSFLKRLDDPRHTGDLVEEVELAIEKCVRRTVETLNYRSSEEIKKSNFQEIKKINKIC